MQIPSWPLSSPTHSPLVIPSLNCTPLRCQNPQWSFSCSLRANRRTSKTSLSSVSCHLLTRHILRQHHSSEDKHDRRMWWRHGQEWKEVKRKMRIMLRGRRRSGGWAEVKHKRNRMGMRGWEVVSEVNKKRWHKLQRDVGLTSGTNSPSGKGKDFSTTYILSLCFFHAPVNLLFWMQVLFSQ